MNQTRKALSVVTVGAILVATGFLAWGLYSGMVASKWDEAAAQFVFGVGAIVVAIVAQRVDDKEARNK